MYTLTYIEGRRLVFGGLVVGQRDSMWVVIMAGWVVETEYWIYPTTNDQQQQRESIVSVASPLACAVCWPAASSSISTVKYSRVGTLWFNIPN